MYSCIVNYNISDIWHIDICMSIFIQLAMYTTFGCWRSFIWCHLMVMLFLSRSQRQSSVAQLWCWQVHHVSLHGEGMPRENETRRGTFTQEACCRWTCAQRVLILQIPLLSPSSLQMWASSGPITLQERPLSTTWTLMWRGNLWRLQDRTEF